MTKVEPPRGGQAIVFLSSQDAEKPEAVIPTRWAAHQRLAPRESLSAQIEPLERRLKEWVEVTPPRQRLRSLPGVGVILAATVALEIGAIERFPSTEHLASYAGTTPRVHASGDRTRYGRTRPDVNRYLKGAFAEAANSVAVNHPRCPDRPVRQLYFRLRLRKGHTGSGSRGAALGRSCLPRPQPSGTLSRSGRSRGSDQGGVSAVLS